jgi:outer membrane protein TolC
LGESRECGSVENRSLSIYLATPQQVIVRADFRYKAARALAEVQTRYGVCSEDTVAVLNAERMLFIARDAFVAIRAEQLGASVALYPALGGGWTEKVEP